MKRRQRRMISRYNRRPVSHKLEIRGLSRSRLDNHPLPEETDDHQRSQHDLHDLQEPGSIHREQASGRSDHFCTRFCSDTSAASGHSDCPTIISVDSNQSWSGIRSTTGTGISTERSSVFSWGYDEFDKAASRQVQQMFEEIDKELYEGRGGGAGILHGLQDECQQWATRFPHLRIVGTQVVCPGDEGFQWFATSAKSSSEDVSAGKGISLWGPHKDKGSRDLNVQGRRAALLQSSSANIDGAPGSSGGSPGQHKQRVIEVEGLMEEYLAVDSRDLDDEYEQDHSESGHRNHCLPPVSPCRCRRQAVLDLLFDDVWQQLVGWMEELLQHRWECCTVANDKTPGSLKPVRQDSQNSLLLSTVPAMLPKVSHSRVPPITAGQHLQKTKSGGSKHQSPRRPPKQKRPSSAGRVPAGAATAQQNLNDLMVIHSISLQQRNLSLLDRNQDTEERQGHRSGSNTVPSSRTQPRRTLEQSSSSLSRPPQSARRRNPPPRTLLPLVPSSSQTGSIDEVIRGTRLPTANEPLLPLSRNTLLPPIGSGDPDPSQSKPAQQRHKGACSRAHSALNDEAGGLMPRDRHHLLDIFSRPNTTHTYRSDTPYRRSFTVLDNISQGRPGRASVAADSLSIGVTGVSLGVSSSSFLDSSPPHPLGRLPIRDEEEPDPRGPGPAPVSVPARAHPRGGSSSRTSRP